MVKKLLVNCQLSTFIFTVCAIYMEFLNTFNYLVWTIGNLWSTYGTRFFLGVEVHISLLQWRYIFPSSQSKKSGTTFGNSWSRKRPQARWMRMRPSRRRHESYWRPWRTVRIWDPSRRMGFLTYETRGVTEGPRARKELGGAKGDLGNWDLCEFRAMITPKIQRGPAPIELELLFQIQLDHRGVSSTAVAENLGEPH